MLFWIIAAFLTLAACLAVLRPLVRGPRALDIAAEHDLEVYRDQLSELERDAKRGVISEREAEEARAEIARRILKADASREAAGGRASTFVPRWAIALAVLSIPVVSWSVYAELGSPDIPSQPLAARMEKNPAENTVEELIARAEKQLQAHPEQGQGWEVLAPIYMRVNRYEDAVTAYRNAIKLLGKSATRLSGLGEAIGAVAGGTITPDAQSAFKAALELDPANAKSRFFLAAAQAQQGKFEQAIEAWNALAESQPADSPWRQVSLNAIAQARQQVASADGSAAPGPNADQIAAAGEMSTQDRSAMIEGMVARLDEKLRANPDDMEGWQRLVRAYSVLGKKEEASDAVDRAVAAFGSDSAKADEIVAFAKSLGVEPGKPAGSN